MINQVSKGDIRHRYSITVAFDDEKMARIVFDRIKEHLPQELIIGKEECKYKYPGICDSDEVYGTWKPYGLNHKWINGVLLATLVKDILDHIVMVIM